MTRAGTHRWTWLVVGVLLAAAVMIVAVIGAFAWVFDGDVDHETAPALTADLLGLPSESAGAAFAGAGQDALDS